jgi:hypothetical protein
MTPTLQEALRVLEGAKLVPADVCPICPDGENGNEQYHVGWNECRRFILEHPASRKHAQALAVVLEAVRDAECFQHMLEHWWFGDCSESLKRDLSNALTPDEVRAAMRAAIAASGEQE